VQQHLVGLGQDDVLGVHLLYDLLDGVRHHVRRRVRLVDEQVRHVRRARRLDL